MLFLASINASAQLSPIMVEDINLTGLDSDPRALYVFDNKVYFSAEGAQGKELYVYDETKPLGNQIDLVADIYNGLQGSDPQNFMTFNGKLYFSAEQSGIGRELFVYDGVNLPTLVEDLYVGPSSSDPYELTVYNNELYFIASPIGDRELYKYDGNTTIQLVYNLNAGGNGYNTFSDLEVYNNKLYFTGTDGSNNGAFAIYSYDGTSTPIVIPGTQGTSASLFNNPTELIVYNNKLYFTQKGLTSSSSKVWTYDETTVNELSSIESITRNLMLHNNKIFYTALGNAGNELYMIDGTNASVLIDVNTSGSSFPLNLTSVGTSLLFTASDGTNNNLYEYDGTNAPFVVQGDLISDFQNLTAYNGDLIFTGNTLDKLIPNGLSIYDLSNASSQIAELSELRPGNQSSQDGFFKNTDAIEFNGKYYFEANDGINGSALWRYDGTITEFFASLNVNPGTIGSGGDITKLLVVNNELYIGATTGLFKTDGIALPTQITSLPVNEMAEGSNTIYFSSFESATGLELYEYDLVNSPSIVADLEPGSGSFRPENLNYVNGNLYFTKGLGIGAHKFWYYDGTMTPAALPNANHEEPYRLQVFGNKLYFSADAPTPFGGPLNQLFEISSGTIAPTIAINNYYSVNDLGIYNNQLVFTGVFFVGPNSIEELHFFNGSTVTSTVNLNGTFSLKNFRQVGTELFFWNRNC